MASKYVLRCLTRERSKESLGNEKRRWWSGKRRRSQTRSSVASSWPGKDYFMSRYREVSRRQNNFQSCHSKKKLPLLALLRGAVKGCGNVGIQISAGLSRRSANCKEEHAGRRRQATAHTGILTFLARKKKWTFWCWKKERGDGGGYDFNWSEKENNKG